MLLDISRWEIKTDSKDLHARDHSGHLLGDVVLEAPFELTEDINGYGTKDYACQCCERWFREMKAVAYELGEEGISDEKEGEDKVDKVRS